MRYRPRHGTPLPSGRHRVDLETFSQVAPIRDVISAETGARPRPSRSDRRGARFRPPNRQLRRAGPIGWQRPTVALLLGRLAPVGRPRSHSFAELPRWPAPCGVAGARRRDGEHHHRRCRPRSTALVRTSPSGDVAAEITFATGADESLAALLPLVTQRHTNRELGIGEPLAVTPSRPSTRLPHATEPTADGSGPATSDRTRRDPRPVDRIRFLSTVTHRDLFAEMRLTDAETQRSHDGYRDVEAPARRGRPGGNRTDRP